MHPVSLVMARDDQLVDVLINHLDLLQKEKSKIRECTQAQPLPSSDAKRHGSDWKAWFQVGACAPQLSLALRQRVCLGLIEREERERGSIRYDWVIRSRPDIAIPCALPPATIFRASAVRYFMDFIAFFPRAAADTVLREVPLAFEWNVTDCFTYANENAMGLCNAAVARRGGWSTAGGIEAGVWVPEEQRFERLELAYPAREAKPSHSDSTNEPPGHAPARGEIQLFPHPPFGNVSSRSNPVVPNGALYPSCVLAPNATAALAPDWSARPAVPFLIEGGRVWSPPLWNRRAL